MICWGSPQSEFINLGVSSSLRFYFSTTYENSKKMEKMTRTEKHSKRETEKRSEPKNKAKHTDTERTNLSLPWIRFFFSSVVFFSHYFQYSFLFFFFKLCCNFMQFRYVFTLQLKLFCCNTSLRYIKCEWVLCLIMGQ